MAMIAFSNLYIPITLVSIAQSDLTSIGLVAFFSLYGLYLTLKRTLYYKQPIILTKNSFMKDRPIELILNISSIIIGLFAFVPILAVYGQVNRLGLSYILLGSILLLISFLEYQKKQVGLFQEGIVFKSYCFLWKHIFTYRILPGKTDDYKTLIFYIRENPRSRFMSRLSTPIPIKDINGLEEVLKKYSNSDKTI